MNPIVLHAPTNGTVQDFDLIAGVTLAIS